VIIKAKILMKQLPIMFISENNVYYLNIVNYFEKRIKIKLLYIKIKLLVLTA